jgi:hypothetical protein
MLPRGSLYRTAREGGTAYGGIVFEIAVKLRLA